MSQSSSSLYTDAFPNPKYPSKSVDKLTLPKVKNWTETNPFFFVFITIFESYKIYFKKEERKNRSVSVKHLLDYLTGKIENPVKPVNWSKMERRLRLSIDNTRNNEDTRLGFRNGSVYLVKPYFTFGLRTVEEGQSHIIQTHAFPLTMCLYNAKYAEKCPVREKHFSAKSLLYYNTVTLAKNGVYKIPSGTQYILMSFCRNLFALDIVQEPFPLSVAWVDPTKAPQTPKLLSKPKLNDPPPPTPFIDEVNEEEEPPQEEQITFNVIFQDLPFKMPQQPECMPQPECVQQPESECVQQPESECVQQPEPQQPEPMQLEQPENICYIIRESPFPFQTPKDFRDFYDVLRYSQTTKPEKLYNSPDDYILQNVPDKPLDLSYSGPLEEIPAQSQNKSQNECVIPQSQNESQNEWTEQSQNESQNEQPMAQTQNDTQAEIQMCFDEIDRYMMQHENIESDMDYLDDFEWQ